MSRYRPDPSYAGCATLAGIVLMGITGAATAHWAFNAATAIAVGGAVAFVAAILINRVTARR